MRCAAAHCASSSPPVLEWESWSRRSIASHLPEHLLSCGLIGFFLLLMPPTSVFLLHALPVPVPVPVAGAADNVAIRAWYFMKCSLMGWGLVLATMGWCLYGAWRMA